jgi:uncharacterized protein
VTTTTTPSITAASRRGASQGTLTAVGVLLLLMATGGLFVYKASSALKVFAKAQAEGTLHPKARWIQTTDLGSVARPFADSLNYLSWVFIALAFGIVISAMVRAFVPSRWLQRTVAVDGVRGQLIASLAGIPLMLCSCCVAPLFEGVYGRTRRLGPSLGLMLAAPALNPAVLTVTFLLFAGTLAWTRVAVSVLLVIPAAALLGRAYQDRRAPEACPIEADAPSWSRLATGFGESLWAVTWRSLPAILLGIVLSAVVAGLVPMDAVARLGSGGAILVIALVALVAVPLALPTFGEIPLALALIAARAPLGAAVALLIAGPTINLPSLLTLGRATSWKIAAATASTVFVGAVVGGIFVQILSR